MRLQAEQSCDLNDFTNIMHQLLKAAWGDDWGTFTESYPSGRDPKNIKLPMITYTVRSKVPGVVGKSQMFGNETREIKPRYRQTVSRANAPSGEDIALNIYSQIFDYQIDFDLWADNNSSANALADRFEDFMMIYAGYFMQQGVQQIIFLEMLSPVAQMDDKAISRQYKYLVRLEKQVVVPTSVIKEVIGKVKIAQGSVSLRPDFESDQDQYKEAIGFKSK